MMTRQTLVHHTAGCHTCGKSVDAKKQGLDDGKSIAQAHFDSTILSTLQAEAGEPVATALEVAGWTDKLLTDLAAKAPWTYADEIRARGLLVSFKGVMATVLAHPTKPQAPLDDGEESGLSEIIAAKCRDIDTLSLFPCPIHGGIYVAKVSSLLANAKTQAAPVLGGPEGDSVIGYTIPTGTWLMLQANVDHLIEALSASPSPANTASVEVTDEVVETALRSYQGTRRELALYGASPIEQLEMDAMRVALTAALQHKGPETP